MEVGKRYYFITHAYFHYLGEIVEIIGRRQVKITNVIAVHRCQRGWSEFFAEGCKKDTTYDVLSDGEIEVLNCFEWAHPIPTEPQS